MPTPPGPNMNGPDWMDVTAIMRGVQELHHVDLTIHLCTLPLGGIGELGVVVEAYRQDGTLDAGEPLSLIRVVTHPTSSKESLPATLVGVLYEFDGLLSKEVWQQLKIAGT